jgi:hypothetical protein
MDARHLVTERNLAAPAFGHLTEAFMTLPFDALGPVKTLLKRYLSAGPWSPEDDDALASAVGAGEGWWERALDDDVTLAFGWRNGRFRVELRSAVAAAETSQLDLSFDGPVIPEATPNPRSIRFGFGHPVNTGPSRWYESATAAADEPPVARLFAEFDRVTNVLVGPDFVAVGLRRPDDWEALLAPILAVVTEEFADLDEGPSGPLSGQQGPAVPVGAAGGPAWLAGGARAGGAGGDRRLTRLERAWRDLGVLRPADPDGLAQVLDAAAGPDPSRRQVAANLLREGDPAAARAAWGHLLHDPVRAVRRATVDAMVDAGREELRPLLEAALGDADAWVRWKALRGLVELGPAPSRTAIVARADDPDFRVRLEAAAALR